MSKHVMRWLLLAFAFVAGSAAAQTGHGGAGNPDPFNVSYAGTSVNPVNFPPNNDTIGRSPAGVLQGVDITKKNLVIVTAGQSNIINTAPTAYTPTNASKISNLNFNDGALYPVPSDPLIGVSCSPLASCGGASCLTGCLGNVATRIADAYLTAGTFDRVILAPIGIGGTTIATWAPGGGLALNGSRIAMVLARLAAKGITASTTNVTIVIMWGQGESDCGAGPGTAQATYVASFNAMVASAGPFATGVRWFVTKETFDAGVTCSGIQGAQTATTPTGVINNAANIFAGVNLDALINSICGVGAASACRQTDNLHATDAMNITYSANAITAFHASGAPL